MPDDLRATWNGTAFAARGGLWFRADDWSEADIPARPWVAHGYLLRGSVTVLAGAGGAGKSSLVVGWTIASALALPFGKFRPKGPCRVVVYNVEDDDDEQRRRFSAALRSVGRLPRDLENRVFRCGPRDIGTLVARHPETGAAVSSEAFVRLAELVKMHRPGVVVLDPLVELHTEEENDNTALRHVIAQFRTFAVEHDCAVVLVHHARKGAAAGEVDGIRGAGAIVGAARVALTVATMTEDEAAQLSVPPDLRRSYFRVDNAKGNYCRAGEAAWHELVEHELANGDLVAAAVPWQPRAPQSRPAAPEAMALVMAEAARGTVFGPYSPRLAPDQPRSIAALMVKHGITRPADQKLARDAMLREGWSVQEFYDRDGDKRNGLRSPDGAPETKWKGGSGE